MEREVHRQQYEFLDETKLAAIALLDQVRLAVDKDNLVAACFIDLQKAFDIISHKKLTSKLERYGVRDKELDWCKSYFFNRQIRV